METQEPNSCGYLFGKGWEPGRQRTYTFLYFQVLNHVKIYLVYIYIYNFGPVCVMPKFTGQGPTLSHSSDNSESLTTRLPGNTRSKFFLINFFLTVKFFSPQPCLQHVENPSYSSDSSCCSDNARSLTSYTTRESLNCKVLKFDLLCQIEIKINNILSSCC